jgi:hypothetical protein
MNYADEFPMAEEPKAPVDWSHEAERYMAREPGLWAWVCEQELDENPYIREDFNATT